MKKIVCLIIALIMALSLASTSFGFVSSTPDTTKKLDISVGYYGSPEGMDKDEMGKYIQSKFNVKIKYVATDNNKLKVMGAANNLPDVFPADMMDSLFSNFKKSGLIREVPASILAKYPNVKKMTDMSAVNQAYRKYNGGKLYSIAHPHDADTPVKSYGVVMYMRADWLKNVNMKQPTTMDELYKVLKAFTFNDPDKNSKNDTYGISGKIWSVFFSPWIDYYGWVKENGKWIPGYVSDQMKPALAFYSRLYKEKILDPEFALANPKQKFFSGKVGFEAMNGTSYWLSTDLEQFKSVNAGKNIKDTVLLLPPLKKDANSKPQYISAIESDSTVFSKKCTDEKLHRILNIINWGCTDEGRMFAAYGFKDKDYTIKNGKVVSNLPKNDWGKEQVIWQAYPSVQFFQLVAWNVKPPVPAENPAIPTEYENMWNNLEKNVYGPYCPTPNYAVNLISTPAKEKFNVGIMEIEDQLQKIISTRGDAVADFEKYRTKLLKVNGLQKVIDEVNAAAKKQGIK